MIHDLFTIFAAQSFWIAVLRIGTPLILGTLGVLLCERCGVLNLGIEGIMVAGAYTGWLAVYHGANLWVGVLVGAATGAAFGLLHALLTVGLALAQHVVGLGITLLATSLASFSYRLHFPRVTTPPTIQPFAEMHWLHIPVLSAQTPLTLLALVLVPLVGYGLYRTPAGLALRMAGENPAVVEAQGLSVYAVRTLALAAGSALMGVAGAYLTLSEFNAFFSTWSMDAAGSAWRWWSSPRGGRARRCWGHCSSRPLMPCNCGCSNRAAALCPTRFSSCCPMCSPSSPLSWSPAARPTRRR